jgi:hypothetical protein
VKTKRSSISFADHKPRETMPTNIRKSAVLAVAVGLVTCPLATAGSIKTFHRSWSHRGEQSDQSSSTSTVAKSHKRGSSVVQDTPGDPAKVPTKTKATSKSAKSQDKTAVDGSEKTAMNTTGTNSR